MDARNRPLPSQDNIRPNNGKQCLTTSDLWPADNPTNFQIDLNWHPTVKRAVEAVVDWHKQETGALVLAGGYGCGKTSLAKIVLNAVGGPIPVIDWSSGRPESIRNAIFYSEPALLEDIRASYRSGNEGRIIGQCRTAKLLILDDLGAGYVKDESQRWYEDIIWRVLNERHHLKTLITTNLNPADVKLRIGGRAFSRLREMLGSGRQFVGLFDVPDYRAKDW